MEQRSADGGTLLVRIDYTYDVFGNRLSRMEYDGTLTLVSTEQYGYDGWKTVDGGYNFIGNENFDVYIDLDGSNDVVARRIFGNSVDNLQARITPDGMTDEVHWYITDRQGSVRGLLDDTGTPIATLTYDGFGNTTSNSNSSATDRYSYTGRELDPTADHLLHVRDRVLALDLGKFLTRDRLGFQAGDVNLTRYVENGFSNATDPSGMKPPPPPFELSIDVMQLPVPFDAKREKIYIDQIKIAQKEFSDDIVDLRILGITDADLGLGFVQLRWEFYREKYNKLRSDAGQTELDINDRMLNHRSEKFAEHRLEGAVMYVLENYPEGFKLVSRMELLQLNLVASNDWTWLPWNSYSADYKNRTVEIDTRNNRLDTVGGRLHTALKDLVDDKWYTQQLSGIGGMFTDRIMRQLDSDPIYEDLSKDYKTAVDLWQAELIFGMSAMESHLKGVATDMLMNATGVASLKIAQISYQKLKVRAIINACSCKRISNACFALGTPILTESGYKNIEDITIGDRVLSVHEDNPEGELTYQPVLQTIRNVSTTVSFSVMGLLIHVTNGHPIYTREHGWKPASLLRQGEHVLTANKTWVSIDQVDKSESPNEVCNFEVSENHTFFVGTLVENAILVHNVLLRCLNKELAAIDRQLGKITDPEAIKALKARKVNVKAQIGKIENGELVDNYDFGTHLKELIGDPPEGMKNHHAHHILFKKGLRKNQQELVEEGQSILRKVGIDPIYGKENLVWAPNITGQHDIQSLRKVVDKLRELDKAGADRDEIVEALRELGSIAAQKGK
ncbi:MAG: polymorphic toxin-type HINT domain-containing protein [Zavarzinella sp.]